MVCLYTVSMCCGDHPPLPSGYNHYISCSYKRSVLFIVYVFLLHPVVLCVPSHNLHEITHPFSPPIMEEHMSWSSLCESFVPTRQSEEDCLSGVVDGRPWAEPNTTTESYIFIKLSLCRYIISDWSDSYDYNMIACCHQ